MCVIASGKSGTEVNTGLLTSHTHDIHIIMHSGIVQFPLGAVCVWFQSGNSVSGESEVL